MNNKIEEAGARLEKALTRLDHLVAEEAAKRDRLTEAPAAAKAENARLHALAESASQRLDEVIARLEAVKG